MTAGRRPPLGMRACARPTTSSPAPRTITARSRSFRSRRERGTFPSPRQVRRACGCNKSSQSRTPSIVPRRYPPSDVSWPRRATSRSLWLSDAIDLGRGADFVKALAPMLDTRPITIVSGGIAGPRALTAADNAAGALSVKVLRAATGGAETGTLRALDLKGLPLGEATFAFKPEDRETEAAVRSAGRDYATTSRGSKLPANTPPARCNCSTSAGGGAPSASYPAPRLTPRSRCCRRAIISPGRSAPFADVRLAQGELPAEAVTHFLDQHLPMLILADVGNVAGKRAIASRAGSTTAACWCVLPARGWRRPTTIWFRSACGAAAASLAAA